VARTTAITRCIESIAFIKSSRHVHDWRNKVIEEPVLPYAGTSGWSGTETSKDRAVTADRSGETSKRQRQTIRTLKVQTTWGITWKELSEIMGWHHGTSSGVLSVLHKADKIARLREKRDKCRVYVLKEYVNGRETDSQGRKPKECPNCGHHL
jgi:hypothetical protein